MRVYVYTLGCRLNQCESEAVADSFSKSGFDVIKDYEKEMPEFRFRMRVKAGLTGFAQIYGKYNTIPYDKLKLDLFYIEHYSLWLDIKLILMTVKIIFKRESTEGIEENQTTAQKEKDISDVEQVVKKISDKQ